MRVLVTGGAGFIGSHIVDLLIAQGHDVAVVDSLVTGDKANVNSRARFYEADITSPGLRDVLLKEKPEVVCHQAAQINVRKSIEDPVFDARNNIAGTINLMEMCKEFGVKRVVFASSGGAIYGEPDYLPCDENHPIKSICPYGSAKYSAELYLHNYNKNYGISCVALRYSNVYGPRQNPTGEAGVVAIFLQKMARDETCTINGDGEQTRDFIYVGDVARANLLAIGGKSSGAYNIGTGKETSINLLFEKLKNFSSSKSKCAHGPAISGEVKRSVLDTTLAKKELGFEPKISLDDGLAKTSEWFKMKKVLITGGAGFVGRHLCKLHLDKGDLVVCVDDISSGSRTNIMEFENNPNFRFVKHNVIEPLKLNIKLDQIYHLASRASPPNYQEYPIHTMLTNSIGTQNMLELALKNEAVMLYSSTSEVYGDPEKHPQREDYWGNVNPVGIRSCYDESKRYAEALCMAYHRKKKAKIRIARIFNTYGPNMHPDDGRVVTNFMKQALRGEDITVYGDGKQTRSFCFIGDLVRGIYALMQSDFMGPVNLGNPSEMSIIEIAERIKKLTGSKSKIVFLPLPKDDPLQRRPDISLAKEKLGWEPNVKIDDGLKKTIEYFKSIGF